MANIPLTEQDLDRVSSRRDSDAELQPDIIQPSTTAAISAFSNHRQGDVVLDTTTNRMQVYNGSSWQNVGDDILNGTYASIIADTSQPTGQLARDTTYGALWVFNGTSWDLVKAPMTYVAGDTPTLVRYLEKDFSTADGAFTENDTSAAGSPTLAVASSADIQGYHFHLAANDEEEIIGIDLNDVLPVNCTYGFIFEAAITVVTAPSTNESVALGVAKTWEGAIPTGEPGIGFALTASADVLAWWADGSSVDIQDGDTGVDVVANKILHVKIDATDPSACKFWVNGVDVTATALAAATGTPTAADVSGAGAPAQKWQPFFQVYKASGAGTPEIYVHAVRLIYIDK